MTEFREERNYFRRIIITILSYSWQIFHRTKCNDTKERNIDDHNKLGTNVKACIIIPITVDGEREKEMEKKEKKDGYYESICQYFLADLGLVGTND